MDRLRQHWKALLVGVVVLVVVLAVGIPYAYIHFFSGKTDKTLSVADAPTGVSGAAGTPVSAVGSWKVGSGSQAGYRVKETLAGQNTTAVGRTSDVSGSITVAGSSVSAASFTVQMASVKSDKGQRDDQFSGRIMDTAKYPTGTFTLTRPIDLGSIQAVGKTITARATGKLTLHGTTQTVSFSVQAKRTASQLVVSGSIPITYSQYNIDNPSVGGFVSVGSSGTVEFLLVSTKSQ